MNFNPYFKQPESAELPFESKTYASDIVQVMYPENVLASEIEKSSDVCLVIRYRVIHNKVTCKECILYDEESCLFSISHSMVAFLPCFSLPKDLRIFGVQLILPQTSL